MKRNKHFYINTEMFYYIRNEQVTFLVFQDFMKYQDCYTEVDVDNQSGNIIIWFYTDEELIASIHIFY